MTLSISILSCSRMEENNWADERRLTGIITFVSSLAVTGKNTYDVPSHKKGVHKRSVSSFLLFYSQYRNVHSFYMWHVFPGQFIVIDQSSKAITHPWCWIFDICSTDWLMVGEHKWLYIVWIFSTRWLVYEQNFSLIDVNFFRGIFARITMEMQLFSRIVASSWDNRVNHTLYLGKIHYLKLMKPITSCIKSRPYIT